MAAKQPFVNFQPFKGTETANIEEFFRQVTSCMQVAGIPDANCHTYLHLRLKGVALAFCDQLPQTTRENYHNAVAALCELYKNDQRIQLQKLKFL